GDVVTDPDARFDKAMIANVAPFPDLSTLHYMSEGPDARARTNIIRFDERVRVFKNIHLCCHQSRNLLISSEIISRRRTTSTPIFPPLIGSRPDSIQSMKCLHSAASGS